MPSTDGVFDASDAAAVDFLGIVFKWGKVVVREREEGMLNQRLRYT